MRIEHEAVAQHDLGVEADLVLGAFVEPGAAREAGVEHVVAAHERERREQAVATRRNVAHTVERRRLVQPPVDALRVRGPVALLARSRNQALEPIRQRCSRDSGKRIVRNGIVISTT